nr:reverse transcriptase domain-containing protein [Tanacetum cinerariifolium]
MADNRTMEELLQAPTEGYGEAIVILEINVDHFEINTNLLQLVQANPYHGFERENPHTHINNFKRITSTLKFRDVPNDVIKLMIFPYSLQGSARVWYDKEPPNSILTWDDLNQASTSGTLPSNTISNLKGEMKVITTRSGVAYEGPSILTPKKVVKQKTEETIDKEQTNFQGSTAHIQPPVTPIPEPEVLKTLPKPNIPYPSRLNDQKLREKATNQMEKFFKNFQDLHFDISFADALLLMPKFASTIKSLLTNKDKLFELAKIPLNENCSAMLLKKLPKKLGDPGKSLIPCDFLGMDVCHALADLGASINLMSLSIWKKLSLPELTPTQMTLKLADRSITRPKGVAEDIFVKVGKFHFPTDFEVVDFEANPRVPLILGRSFLRTNCALIDFYGEEITLWVNDKAVTFNLNQTTRYSSTYDDMSVNRIDVIDVARQEYAQEMLGFSNNFLGGNPTSTFEPIISDSSPSFTPFEGSEFILEEIEAYIKDDSISSKFDHADYFKQGEVAKAKSLIEEPSKLELKDLPSHLEYDYLEGVDKLQVMDIKEKDKIEAKTKQNQAGNGKRKKVNQVKANVKVKQVKTRNPMKILNKVLRKLTSNVVTGVIVSNLEPCHNQNVDELPQTLTNFHATCYSGEENLFAHDSTSNFDNDSRNVFHPPPQTPTNSYEFYGNDAHYSYDCPPQLAEYINIPSWNHPAFSSHNDDDDDDENYTSPITPKEPDNSLSMEDEHLETIPATESEEVIKSSVEDVIPIPRESEGILDNTCDVPFRDNSSPLDVSEDQFEEFSDSNDDSTLIDDDYFSIDNIDYIELSPPDSELVSLEEVKDNNLCEKLLNINLLIAKNKSLNDNPTPDHVLNSPIPIEDSDSFLEKFDTSLSYSDNSLPEFETFSNHTEETNSGNFIPFDNSLPESKIFYFNIEEKNSGSTNIHAYISLSDLECFNFKREPDPGELTSIVNSGIHENVLSATNVNLPPEEDHSPFFAYVVWIFLSFLTYPVVPPNLLSFENEDTIFDPGISNYHFHSLLSKVSHRCGTFMK